MKRTGVILAAGESRRMGRPKALLDWGGECYLDRLIRIFGAHCEDVVVVLRRGGEQQLGGCGRLRAARIAVNEEPERGQMSSLLAGLAAVEAGREVLFTPVDYGHVREETVAALAQAAAGGEWDVIQPRYRGKNGHPVLVGDAVRRALEDAGVEAAARDVLRRYRRMAVDVEDAGAVMDADDPAAYRRIQESAV